MDAPAERRHAPRIVSVATAEPEFILTPREILEHLARVWEKVPRWDLMKQFVANSMIERRHLAYPPEHLLRPRSLEERGREYRQAGWALGRRAAAECLERAGIRPAEVDLLITVTSTEFEAPGLDVQLIGHLGLRPTVRRLPMSGLACASGAVSISRAVDFIRAHPGSTALVLSVELASVTFNPQDQSVSNFVSTAIFGDGAAAALVTGQAGQAGLAVLETSSYLFPGTADQMSLVLTQDGHRVTLGRKVPQLVRRHVRELVEGLCRAAGWDPGGFDFYCLHPGGARVLQALEEALGLSARQTRWSWEVLGEYGNLSSATVLYIVQRALEADGRREGDRGLLAGFGPGFSAELALLEWHGAA